jgi:hypothetical protein
MLQFRVSNIKTQVRRLKYFSVIIDSIGKEGIKKELLQNKIIQWNKSNEIENLKKYSGIISKPSNTLFSQSFKNYLDAALQWKLINSEFDQIYFSRSSQVYRALIKEFENKSKGKTDNFKLNELEKIFYLHIILENDADIFLTILTMLEKEEKPMLDTYLSKFQDYYKNRLINKTQKIDSFYKYRLSDAINRINKWKSAKRYSEDLVPSRCNWMLDLGLINEYKYIELKEYHLNDLALRLRNSILYYEKERIIDINTEWIETHFIHLIKNVYMSNKKFEVWENIDEGIKISIFSEVLNLLLKYFRVLNMPTFSLEQSMLFSTFYIYYKYRIICEHYDLVNWIGINKIIDNRKIGVRKSTRNYESYLYIE